MRDRPPVLADRTRVPTDRPGVEYEIEKVRLDNTWSRNAIRRLLTDRAEYGGWELMRLRRYRDGTREVWVRRKAVKVRTTW